MDNDGPDSHIQHHTEDTQINVNLPTSGIRSKGAKIFVIFYFVCVLCVSLISQYKRRSGETSYSESFSIQVYNTIVWLRILLLYKTLLDDSADS